MSQPVNAEDARPPGRLQALADALIAMLLLALTDALVRSIPFAVIARRIDRPIRQASALGAARVGNVKWAIDAARRRLPWSVPCLAAAIAANRLLAWRGIPSELWLGVRTSAQTPIDAHAWLIADGCVVTGGAEKSAYEPLHALMTRATPLP